MTNKFLCFLIVVLIILAVPKSIWAQEDKYELKSIDFVGNAGYSSTQLKTIVRSKESPAKIWQFVHSFTSLGADAVFFDSLLIQSDLKNLYNFYNTGGYFDTRIEYHYIVDSIDKSVGLTYTILEGTVSKYGSVRLHGLESYPQEYKWRLPQKFKIDTTQNYSQPELVSNINNLLRYLRTDGFMIAKYDSAVVLRDTTKLISDVDIFLTLGNKFKFGETTVIKEGDGAGEVSEELVKGLVGIEKDAIYNLDRITQSQVRLYRTGLFNYVRVATPIDSLNPKTVPIKVQGTIGKINELGPEFIINNEQNSFNVGVALSYVRKNFFGAARKFTIKPSVSFRDILNINYGNIFAFFDPYDNTVSGSASTTMTIEQPYFLGEPIFAYLDFIASYSKLTSIGTYVYKSTLKFEFELPQHTFVNYFTPFYSIENTIDKTVENNILYSQTYLTAGLGMSARATHVDNILFPTTGYSLSFYLEEGNFFPFAFTKLIGGEFNRLLFYKAQNTSAYYTSLNDAKTIVFAAKFSAGYVHGYYGPANGLPSTKKFFVGGSNSVRGWGPRSFPVTQSLIDSAGGKLITEGSFELRNKFAQYFGWALFLDYGNAWNDPSLFTFSDIAVASGFGVRMYTPYAVIRVDFGFKVYDPLDKSPILNRKLFDMMEIQFGIGEAF